MDKTSSSTDISSRQSTPQAEQKVTVKST
jgi:hypothetical protein